MLAIKKNKIEFSGLGMVISLVLLVVFFGLVHGYLEIEPFENYLSILIGLYFVIASWAFPYILKELMESIFDVERIPMSMIMILALASYSIAPFIYLYFKFSNIKNKKNAGNNEEE